MSNYKASNYKYKIIYILISLPFIVHIFLSFFNVSNSIHILLSGALFISTVAYIYRYLLSYDKTTNKLIDELKATLHENRELLKYNEIKEVMLQISYSIINIKNIEDLMKVIVDSAVKVIDKADTASILLQNEEGLFEFKAIHGFDSELLKIKLSKEETFLRDWPDENYTKARIINYPQKFDNAHMSKDNYNKMSKAKALNIKSTICTPIVMDGRIYGLVNVDSLRHEGIFREEDRTIMEYLASQLTLAIKNVRLLEKTIYLSRYDGLTEVFHRHYFDELFENLYSRSLRYNEEFCLCAIDMDNVKRINDLYGHEAGDMAIKYFAQIIKQNIRETDLLGRYGGDEFIVVFINTSTKDVEEKISIISEKVANSPVYYQDNLLNLSFSYGISSFPKDSKDSKELFKIADSRMYNQKIIKKVEDIN